MRDRAAGIDGKSNAAIRNFYEQQFSAYQIRDDDRKPDGVVTGYFEPRDRRAAAPYGAPPFIYPVYGQPDDMLFVDARKLLAGERDGGREASQGRNVTVQTGVNSAIWARPASMRCRPGDHRRATPSTARCGCASRARRLLDHTREEIETKGAPNAKVLAFVTARPRSTRCRSRARPHQRFASGEKIRLGYAEQNGQPLQAHAGAGLERMAEQPGQGARLVGRARTR